MMSKKPTQKSKVLIRKTVFLLTVLLIGCGSSNEKTGFMNGDTTSTFYSLAVINRFEPELNTATARGKDLYTQYCVICHGESGDGNGFNAYNLKSNLGVQPFDFTDSTAVAEVSFEEIKAAIAYGGPAVKKSPYMPPWGGLLSEYDLVCLTDYVWHVLMSR